MATKPSPNARISDDAVQARTGKPWAEWFRILDAAGAKKMAHKEIVAHIAERYGIGGWWCQMVTVTYEQARGLRELHERPDGYQIGASKTVPVPIDALYEASADARKRRGWLGESVTVRKATPNKSMRITWSDAKTSVDVNFYERGAAKSQVTLQHTKLPSAKAADRVKAFWKGALERLAKAL